MSLTILPLVLKSNIITFLPTIANVGVNKELNALVNKEKFWKQIAKKCHISGLDPFEPVKTQVIGRIKVMNRQVSMLIPTSDKGPIDAITDPFEKFEAIKKYFFITKKENIDSHFAAVLKERAEGSPIDLVSLFLGHGAKTSHTDYVRDVQLFKILLEYSGNRKDILDKELKNKTLYSYCDWGNVDTLLTSGARPTSQQVESLITLVLKEFYIRCRDNSRRPEFLHAFMLQMLCKDLTEAQKKELTSYIDKKREGEEASHILQGCDLVQSLVNGKTLFSMLNFNQSNRERELKEREEAQENLVNSLEDDVICILSNIKHFSELARYLKYCTPSDKEKLLQGLDFAEREVISGTAHTVTAECYQKKFAQKREIIKSEALQKEIID